MIKLQEMTPAIYYKQSRDFQFLGRLYDIVLNSVKTNADLIYNLPFGNNLDLQMLSLLAYTLGFSQKHHYTSTQLKAICSVLPTVMRNKGSVKSITIAIGAILHAEGIKDSADVVMNYAEGLLSILIPDTLSDISLIEDLLEYLIPAGISVTIIRTLKETVKAKVDVYLKDIVKVNTYDSNSVANLKNFRSLSQVPRLSGDQTTFSAKVTSNENRDSTDKHSTVGNYSEKIVKENN